MLTESKTVAGHSGNGANSSYSLEPNLLPLQWVDFMQKKWASVKASHRQYAVGGHFAFDSCGPTRHRFLGSI